VEENGSNRYRVAIAAATPDFEPAAAQTRPATTPSTPTADAAVRNGLSYLAKQQKADGSFDTSKTRSQ
jgi:hypothetical protein